MIRVKNHLFYSKSLLAYLLFSLICSFPLYAEKVIAITQIVEHPSLNAIREGIVDELSNQGYIQGKNLKLIFESAQGSPVIASQIAQKFSSLPHLDVIIPISTSSTQPIVQRIKDKPIVFAAVTDPVAAKIVSSLDHPNTNVTGVADIPPLKEQLQYIKNCVPHLKTLGLIYNPGEANSFSFLKKLKELANAEGIQIEAAAAFKSGDVHTASQSLADHVDAIFIGNDNTVVSGLEPLIKTCLTSKIPLFMSDPDSVSRGAFSAYAYDQKDIGHQVGRIVVDILKGKKTSTIPVQKPDTLKLTTNPKTARALNLSCHFEAQKN